jgi:hypothetical protein
MLIHLWEAPEQYTGSNSGRNEIERRWIRLGTGDNV